MNKSTAKNFPSRIRVARAVLMAGALLAIGLAQSARADTINFDSIPTIPGSTVDISTTNYLAQYGITLANVTAGSKVNVFNTIGNVIVAPSGPNVLTQGGPNNGESYTLVFSTPLSNLSFIQAGNSKSGGSGTLVAAWSATAYNAGNVVLSSVGNPNLFSTFSPFPVQSFNLVGPLIDHVTFFDNCFNVCGTKLLIDDLSSPDLHLAPVPEPATLLLLALGLLGMAGLRTKRRL